ncbi:hypothetical protein BDQ17DRAFT_1549392 [Cyathus striatus]|nr:hypothetical protein BDQ17DRAFT_1549392 [Cyathus striatus]
MATQEFYNTNPNSNRLILLQLLKAIQRQHILTLPRSPAPPTAVPHAPSNPGMTNSNTYSTQSSEPPMVFYHPPTPPGKAGVGSSFGSAGGVMSPAAVPPPLPSKFADAASPPPKPKHSTQIKHTTSTSITRFNSKAPKAPPSAHSTATSPDDTLKIRHVELERLFRSKLVSPLRSESKEYDARNLLHSSIDQLSTLDGKYHTAEERTRTPEGCELARVSFLVSLLTKVKEVGEGEMNLDRSSHVIPRNSQFQNYVVLLVSHQSALSFLAQCLGEQS